MVLDLCITFLLPESYQINNLLTLLASVRLVAAALSCSLRCGGGAFSKGEGEKRAGLLKSGIAPLTSRFKYSLGRQSSERGTTCDVVIVREATANTTKNQSWYYDVLKV